jgi:hypothetical protein
LDVVNMVGWPIGALVTAEAIILQPQNSHIQPATRQRLCFLFLLIKMDFLLAVVFPAANTLCLPCLFCQV